MASSAGGTSSPPLLPGAPRRLPRAGTKAAYRHALAVGFDRAFLVAAAVTVLMLVTAITMIRVRRADLAGHS